MKIGNRVLQILMASSFCLASMQSVGAGTSMPSNVNTLKARYYFLEGSIKASEQKMDEAYEYFKKAYETDPSYNDAGFTYGNQRMFLRSDTLQSEKELLKSLGMMQKYVDANPKDLYSAQMYGYVSTALDTVEESIRVYETTYGLLPAETQLLQLLADSYMRLNRGKDAVEALEK